MTEGTRVVRLVLCNTGENVWIIVFYHDNEEVVAPTKKK